MAPSRSSHHAASLPRKGANVSAFACIPPGKKGKLACVTTRLPNEQGPKLGLSPRPLWHLSLAIAVGLHIFWPVSLPYAVVLPDFPRYILGSLMIAGGASLIAGAAHVFREARENPKPSSPSQKLLVEGPYRYSRNPMYTGGAMTMIGISLLLSSLWFLLVPLVTLVLVKYLIILPEEAYLDFRFGNEYRRYKESVRRWF